MATDLVTMIQLIGITMGVPILGAVAATQSNPPAGVHLAVAVNSVLTVAAVALIWRGLRPHRPQPSPGAAVTAPAK